MDYWMLLPFLVLVLPALLLVGIGRRQRGKLFSQARSQFPELGDGRHARFAGIYRLEDLDVNQLRGSGARTGFVTLTADALQVYRVLPGGRWERRSFLPRTVRVGLIESGHLSTILPSLIRVVAPTEAFYLTALSRDVRPDGKQTRAWFSELDSRIPAEPVAGVPSRPGFASNLVLWGLLILLTSASVFAVGSALRMSPEGAPKLLARGQGGEVLVASAVELFRLDEAGALLERIPLADLGLHDGITRMVRAPDGSYLTGDLGGGSLKRCDLAARSCETLPGFADGTERFVKAFDFALDGPGSRILLVAVLWGAWSSRKRLEVIARAHPQPPSAPG